MITGVTDVATIDAMWKSLTTDVRNWSCVTVGCDRGTIDEETHRKIVMGSTGRAEIVRIASEEAKKEAMEDHEGTSAQDATLADGAVCAEAESMQENGVVGPSKPRAAAISCGFVDELKGPPGLVCRRARQ